MKGYGVVNQISILMLKHLNIYFQYLKLLSYMQLSVIMILDFIIGKNDNYSIVYMFLTIILI